MIKLPKIFQLCLSTRQLMLQLDLRGFLMFNLKLSTVQRSITASGPTKDVFDLGNSGGGGRVNINEGGGFQT